MKVVVTGGRDYKEARHVFRALDSFLEEEFLQIAQGGCPTGADLMARNWATFREVPNVTYYPDWETYGKSAGPKRNRKMLEDFKPDVVLAFPGGRGTADCVRQAIAMGIPVREVV